MLRATQYTTLASAECEAKIILIFKPTYKHKSATNCYGLRTTGSGANSVALVNNAVALPE
jgi:hypothetical protein